MSGWPLERRTPMKRGGQLARARLKPRSDKRIGEKDQRHAVVAEVMARDKDCFGKERVPEVRCRGEHYVHELAQRSVKPGSHLDARLAVRICPAHDDWLCNNIAEAHERGLLMRSWDADKLIGFD